MSWSFAIVNGRLAEIFFDEDENKKRQRKRVSIFGHCYVRKEEYTTKKEQAWIEKDTKEMRLIYRKGMYALRKDAGERAKKLTIISKKPKWLNAIKTKNKRPRRNRVGI